MAAPSHEVIPFHTVDNMAHNKAMILDLTLCFSDVLDPQRLESSLNRLLERDDWRKFGGSVHESAPGKAEYHVPESFDSNRPGVLFSTVHHDLSVKEHPIASRLPHGGGQRPAVFEDPKIFHPFFTSPHSATKWTDYTSTERPPLTVYLQIFHDATFLTLNFSHSFMDATACSSFLMAWTNVLNHEVPTLQPVAASRTDPILLANSTAKPEDFIYFRRLLSRLGFYIFVVYMICEMVFHPTGGVRTIHLPQSYVQKLRTRAIAEASAVSAEPTTFLSEGDVLLAWWVKSLSAAMNMAPNTPVVVGNVVSYRGFIDTIPKDTTFIGNAVTSAYSFFTAAELATRSVGEVALEIRDSLLQFRTKNNLEAGLANLRKESAKGMMPIVGEPNMLMVHWTNWSRGGFYDLDFGGALVKPGFSGGAKPRAAKPAQPTYLNLNGHENGFSTRNSGLYYGKDAHGDYWIRSHARESVCKVMEQHVRDFEREFE